MKKFLFISILAAGLASCDSYLDINQDPNSPTEENITTDMLMPAAEMNVAASYGDYLRITGGYLTQVYAQYFGTSNYLDYSQFQMSAARSSSFYTQMTQRGQNNLKTIREKAAAEGDAGTYLAATVLRAFAYQALVDCYGEIPYTQALDENNLSPAYDDGLTVYNGLLAELDEALANVTTSSPVCTNFLFPDETAEPWIKFAKALKLRILMRMWNAQDVSTEVSALIAENDFPTADVAYTSCWADTEGARNPFYSEDFAPGQQQNLILNQALLGTMQLKDENNSVTYQDPRLAAFFNANTDGEYVGGISGSNLSTAADITSNTLCRPVATATMPLCMLTVAETEFFIAEYYARTNNASQAQSHYEAAIEASFASAGVEGAAENIAQYPYDQANFEKCIGIAKWIAMSGVNPFEGYCDVRRLGYPTFGTATGDDFFDAATGAYDVSSYEPGTLYTPIMVFNQVGNNQVLQRWPYPVSSSSTNANTPDFPGYTVPVFWAE